MSVLAKHPWIVALLAMLCASTGGAVSEVLNNDGYSWVVRAVWTLVWVAAFWLLINLYARVLLAPIRQGLIRLRADLHAMQADSEGRRDALLADLERLRKAVLR